MASPLGSASPAYLRRALDALEAVLPRVRRVVLDGLDHGATGNRDERGHPEAVATHVRAFLGLD